MEVFCPSERVQGQWAIEGGDESTKGASQIETSPGKMPSRGPGGAHNFSHEKTREIPPARQLPGRSAVKRMMRIKVLPAIFMKIKGRAASVLILTGGRIMPLRENYKMLVSNALDEKTRQLFAMRHFRPSHSAAPASGSAPGCPLKDIC